MFSRVCACSLLLLLEHLLLPCNRCNSLRTNVLTSQKPTLQSSPPPPAQGYEIELARVSDDEEEEEEEVRFRSVVKTHH
jgi:hypothetical protein